MVIMPNCPFPPDFAAVAPREWATLQDVQARDLNVVVGIFQVYVVNMSTSDPTTP